MATLGPAHRSPSGTSRTDRALRGRRFTSRLIWKGQYISRLRVNAIAVVLAVAPAECVRFADKQRSSTVAVVSCTVVSVILAGLWITSHSRSPRVLASGAEGYRRIICATFRLLSVVATASLLLRVDIARLYLAVTFTVGRLEVLLNRWTWRKVVSPRRSSVAYQTALSIIGSRRAAASMARTFERTPPFGYAVVGMCPSACERPSDGLVNVETAEISVPGDENDVLAAIAARGENTVAVTATDHLGHAGIYKLVLDLEKKDVDLLVTPGVVDVSRARVVMHPVVGSSMKGDQLSATEAKRSLLQLSPLHGIDSRLLIAPEYDMCIAELITQIEKKVDNSMPANSTKTLLPNDATDPRSPRLLWVGTV